MKPVDLHDAETDLAGLVDRAAEGECFAIAREGRPLVKVVPVDAPAVFTTRRIGSLKGQISVPDDVDTMGQDEIIRMFEGERDASSTRISCSGQPATRRSSLKLRAPSSCIRTRSRSSAS